MGCDSGVGDALSTPAANPYGDGDRLHDVLGPAPWFNPKDKESANCSGIPQDRPINVTGITLTTIDKYDETGGGQLGNHYVQDSLVDPLPYSGITVFQPGFSPPDLRIIPGDVLDIFGLLTEFPGPGSTTFDYCKTLPEMSGAMELRFDGGAVVPKSIYVEDLADYEGGRKWLGMLVTLRQVKLIQKPYIAPTGRNTVCFETGETIPQDEIFDRCRETQPSISNELFEWTSAYPDLDEGDTLAEVTGILTFFFSFHVAPRSAADIVLQ